MLAQLPGCAIAHFACHGASDPADPSQSLLLLHDHDSDPLTVASLAPINLDHAQLAYLSACSTALTGDAELIDEAIHLTTAFQLAGFPHVIGTLWEINDAIAVTIADTFYTALRTSRRHPRHQPRRPRPPPRRPRRTRQAPRHPIPVGRLPARRRLTHTRIRSPAATNARTKRQRRYLPHRNR